MPSQASHTPHVPLHAPVPPAGGTARLHAGGSISLEAAQLSLLWLLVFSGWYVMMEPAPYEILFVLAFFIFLPGGLAASIFIAPLVIFLVLYNMGGAFSVAQLGKMSPYLTRRVNLFFYISIYLAITAIFFAMATIRRPEVVARVVRNAWVVSGVVGAVAGIMGYFDIAGTNELFTKWVVRVKGGFKDPNVYGVWLVPAAVFLMQDLMLGVARRKLLSIISLLLILGGIFLSFSRGAWIVMLGAMILLGVFTFATTRQPALRQRIIFIAFFVTVAGAVMLMIMLSIPSIRAEFADRFTLFKDYDSGETGRFGRQLRSLPMLILRPNGFGPTGFATLLGEDPHNVYINAFSAYGWLGGLSYLLLIISTLLVGLRGLLIPSPYRRHVIAFFVPMFMHILQGIQIDTDHWRHFYLLLGMTWGLYAASEMWLRQQRAQAAVVAQAPHAPSTAMPHST